MDIYRAINKEGGLLRTVFSEEGESITKIERNITDALIEDGYTDTYQEWCANNYRIEKVTEMV